jgi:uncharacterized damage-inducible protein DinB
LKLDELLEEYARGPGLLRAAVAGMSREQIAARPVAGKWSTLEVVCHIADFEPVYADRMKRVLAEESPRLLSGDPDRFAAALNYPGRDLEEELALIEVVRRQMVRILEATPAAMFQRTGQHSEDGPLTLETLLTRITKHIPHHVEFIAEKRKALGA